MYICMCICICICLCLCLCICVCMCVCIGIYIYICIGVVVYNVVCSCYCLDPHCVQALTIHGFRSAVSAMRSSNIFVRHIPCKAVETHTIHAAQKEQKSFYYILSRPRKVLPCKRLLPHWSHTIACRPKHKASEMDTSRDWGLQLRPQRFKLRLANTLRLQLTHEAPPQFFVHTYGAGIGHRLRQYVS